MCLPNESNVVEYTETEKVGSGLSYYNPNGKKREKDVQLGGQKSTRHVNVIRLGHIKRRITYL